MLDLRGKTDSLTLHLGVNGNCAMCDCGLPTMVAVHPTHVIGCCTMCGYQLEYEGFQVRPASLPELTRMLNIQQKLGETHA